MKQIKLFIFLLLVTTCYVLNAQNFTGTIYGEVIDKQSNVSLPGANIVIYSSNIQYGTITDTNGTFKIENIPVGRVGINVSYIGYNIIVIENILLTSGKNVYLTIELEEDIKKIDEVTIKAYFKDKAKNEFASVSARPFTVEETNKYAGSWGDPARMVSNYAGVISAGDQRNDIIIRGNSPTGLLWRLDGMTIPNPNHFGSFGTTGGPICILNNNQLSNSDFFTGAFPAEFGNALSGVFDLEMRKGNSLEHEFLGQMGFNGFEIGAEGPLAKKQKSSYLINYRYTMMDLMNLLGLFDVGGIPKYTDLSFKIFIPTKKTGTFSLIGIGGMSKINLEESNNSGWTSEMLAGTEVCYGSNMGVTGITNKYFLSEKTRIESSVCASYSGSFNDVDSLQENNTYNNYYDENYAETKYNITSKIISKLNSKNTFLAGINIEFFDFSFYDKIFNYNLNKSINYTDINKQTALYQSYAQIKHRITGSINLNFGLHGQIFSLNQSKILEPRLGIDYTINYKHSIKLGYGLHGQTQPMLIYFTQTLADTLSNKYSLTNENLDFTKSHHFIVGYDYKISENLRFKIESYYQYLYNIPVEQNNSYYSMVNFGSSFYSEKTDSLVNEGVGKNKGIELTVEKFLSNNFYFLLTSTFYNSKYKGSNEKWRNSAFNGNYIVNYLTGYEIPINNNALSFNIKIVWAGGKRYIPININESALKGETVYNYEDGYNKRYPDYFRTDLRISFRQNLTKTSQEWSFDVQNLTNHKNIYTRKYEPDLQQVVDILQMELFMIGSWKIYF